MINKETHLAIGKIHSSFALQGGVKIFCYADEYHHLKKLENHSLILLRNNIEQELKVCKVEFKGEWPILFFEGFTNPEIVKEKLKGGEIHVPRHLAAPLDEDEFYLSDLIGLTILFNKEPLGLITHYFEAAHIIVEVKLIDGSVKHFPFIEKYFSQPNFKLKEVTLICEDLLE